MTTREFFFKGHSILGRIFTLPVLRFAAIFAGTCLLLLFLLPWLLNLHSVPCSVEGKPTDYGFWYKLNWTLLYIVVLPIIFTATILLSNYINKSVQDLCSPSLRVINKKEGVDAPEYPEALSNKLAKSARPLVIIVLLLAVGLSIIDTADLWKGYYYYNEEPFPKSVQPDWDTAFTGFENGKYEEACSSINCAKYKRPGLIANLTLAIIAYTLQGIVFFLALFWVGKFYWFLKTFSALIRREESPYQFDPLDDPEDPDTRMGLRPMGSIFNVFLMISILFQAYIFYHRLQLVGLFSCYKSPGQYFLELFHWPSQFNFAFDTVDTSTWLLLLFMGVPIIVICYFPLWTLRRYIKERRNEAYNLYKREFIEARKIHDTIKERDLAARMNVLAGACVWPNGDKAARRCLIIMMILAGSSLAPPLLPYLIVLGGLIESGFVIKALWRNKRSAADKPYIDFKRGLDKLNDLLKPTDNYWEFTIFEAQLLENLDKVRAYGDDENKRSRRNEIVANLNKLALEALGKSFNDLM